MKQKKHKYRLMHLTDAAPLSGSGALPLLLLLAALPMLPSCVKEQDMLDPRGSGIVFRSTTSWKNDLVSTRTEYSGKNNQDLPVGEGSTHERIDWVADSDRLRILCPQADGAQTADYVITGAAVNAGHKERSEASLVPADVTLGGLKWGTGDHSFFAMYPAPGTVWNYDAAQTVGEGDARIELIESGAKARITGAVPTGQQAVKVGSVFKPNMNYAYMYAAASAASGAVVTLPFRPLVTTFEFLLHATDEEVAGRTLKTVILRSSSTPLSGSFTAAFGTSGAPEIATSGTSGQVSVSMPAGTKLSSTPVSVTLLTLPVDQTDLTLELVFEDAGGASLTRKLALSTDSGPITIPACKKVIIDNLNVQEPLIEESMELEITANTTVGKTFRLPFYLDSTLPTPLVVNWGDGSAPERFEAGYAIDVAGITHDYATDGDYTVQITSIHETGYDGARIPRFSLYYSPYTFYYLPSAQVDLLNSYRPMLTDIPTAILRMTGADLSNAFLDCSNLKSICSETFSKNPQITNMYGLFENCTSLDSIPSGLFDNNPALESFSHTFYGCSGLDGTIPAELFKTNTAVKNFFRTFYGCSGLDGPIPAELFKTNTAVISFYATFYGCSSLDGPIPAELFQTNTAVTDFNATFSGCSSLSGPIPAELFQANTAVTSFQRTFYDCSSLSGPLPAELFQTNTAVKDFNATFYGCSGLSGPLPAELFQANTAVTTFSSTFMGCSGLDGSIPAELFQSNTAVKTFVYTFYRCSSLDGPIPAELFQTNTAATSFHGTFYDCRSLSGPIPSELFQTNTAVKTFSSTFDGCSSLTGSIPAELFQTNTAVVTFSRTFSGCSSLTGSIPAALFKSNPAVTLFSSTFFGCSSLEGPIPAELFQTNTAVTSFQRTFYDCSSLSGPLPAELFQTNAAVTDFVSTFDGCSSLTGSIPAELFQTNTAVTSFMGTFSGCSSLTGSIPAALFQTNTAVTSFSSTFEGCSSLDGTIPGELFQTNTAVVTFSRTFSGCNSLTGSIPSGLFEYNLQVVGFDNTFQNCYKVMLRDDIFTGTTQTPQTRFAGMTSRVDMNYCFNYVGRALAAGAGGVAPALWNYTFGGGVRAAYPFRGATTLANYSDIPAGWK